MRNHLPRKAYVAVVLLATAALLAACGTNTDGGSAATSGSPTDSGGEGAASGSGGTIAFLMPCSTCADRFESKDQPYFTEEVAKLDPSITVIANNAQGSASTQLQQAESALTNGAGVILISPFTSEAGASVVEKASAENVPVIAYDGMIEGAVPAAYISFDNETVGKMQGQYLVDNLKDGDTVVMINGAPDAATGVAFKKGAHDALDPAFDSGKLILGYEADTAGFDPATAQRSMEQALTALGDNVQAVLCPNDGIASAVITALTARGLNGKVVVTGQDATDSGLTHILAGDQSMTVYKSIRDEAAAAAKLAVALLQGDTGAVKAQATSEVDNGTGTVPAILLDPVSVTKDNLADTVIADNFTTWEKICVGEAASQCPTQ